MHIADKDQTAQKITTAKTKTQTLPCQQHTSILQQQNNITQRTSEKEKEIIEEERCIDEQITTELEDDDGTFHIHTNDKYDKTALHEDYKSQKNYSNNTTNHRKTTVTTCTCCFPSKRNVPTSCIIIFQG